MDLVSTTLERYLKHRFNGNQLHQQQDEQPQKQKQQQQSQTPRVEIQKSSDVANGITPDTSFESKKLPHIYNLSIRNTQPCCFAIREDLNYMAAGFENSQIHLWKIEHNNELCYANVSDTNNIGNDANNADDNTNCDDADVLIENDRVFREPLSNNIKKHPTNSNYSVVQQTTLLAHSGSVYGIQFIRNDDLMLSCSEDTTVRLWCLKTACNLIIYRGHNYPIWSLDIGPQGLLFATCSMDATARLWRLDKMTPLRIFCGHDADVEVVKFHPNEKYIATGSTDATVRLWSVSDGLMVRLMVGHQERIVNLSFLPDGKFLASASCDGIIKLWDLTSNAVASQLTVPATHMISFSPKFNFISSCGVDNKLRMLQLVDGISKPKMIQSIDSTEINLDGQTARLLQTEFNEEDKLFVITFRKEENKETNRLT